MDQYLRHIYRLFMYRSPDRAKRYTYYEVRLKGSSDFFLATVGPNIGKDGEVEEEAGHPHQDEGPTAPVLT